MNVLKPRRLKTLGTDNCIDSGKREWTGKVFLRKKVDNSIICELFTDNTAVSKDTIGLTSFIISIINGKFFLPLCMRRLFKNGYIVDDSMANKVIIEQA